MIKPDVLLLLVLFLLCIYGSMRNSRMDFSLRGCVGISFHKFYNLCIGEVSCILQSSGFVYYRVGCQSVFVVSASHMFDTLSKSICGDLKYISHIFGSEFFFLMMIVYMRIWSHITHIFFRLFHFLIYGYYSIPMNRTFWVLMAKTPFCIQYILLFSAFGMLYDNKHHYNNSGLLFYTCLNGIDYVL